MFAWFQSNLLKNNSIFTALLLCFEPEAAAIACKAEGVPELKAAKKSKEFPKGTRYILVDCGGT